MGVERRIAVVIGVASQLYIPPIRNIGYFSFSFTVQAGTPCKWAIWNFEAVVCGIDFISTISRIFFYLLMQIMRLSRFSCPF